MPALLSRQPPSLRASAQSWVALAFLWKVADPNPPPLSRCPCTQRLCPLIYAPLRDFLPKGPGFRNIQVPTLGTFTMSINAIRCESQRLDVGHSSLLDMLCIVSLI